MSDRFIAIHGNYSGFVVLSTLKNSEGTIILKAIESRELSSANIKRAIDSCLNPKGNYNSQCDTYYQIGQWLDSKLAATPGLYAAVKKLGEGRHPAQLHIPERVDYALTILALDIADGKIAVKDDAGNVVEKAMAAIDLSRGIDGLPMIVQTLLALHGHEISAKLTDIRFD